MFKLFSFFTFIFAFLFSCVGIYEREVHYINQYFRFIFGCRLLLWFRHLGFSKIRNFNGLSHVRGQCASPCQISSKSVKRLRRYGDLTVFKMAAVRHLGFWKFKFLTIWAVKRPIFHNHAKFREDRSICCCDIAIFVGFQDGGRRQLGFWKIRNFSDLSPVGANLRHHAKFHKIGSNGCGDMAI